MPKVIRLTLTADQRRELDRRLRARTTERREYERLRMVEAVATGATVPQTARTLGVHEQTVRKAVTRFTTEGFAGLVVRRGWMRPIWRRSKPVSTGMPGRAGGPGRCPNWRRG